MPAMTDRELASAIRVKASELHELLLEGDRRGLVTKYPIYESGYDMWRPLRPGNKEFKAEKMTVTKIEQL